MNSTDAHAGGPTGGRRVVFSERLGALGAEEERLREVAGVELEVLPLWSEEALLEHGQGAEVLVVGAPEPVTRRVLAGLPHLKAVVRRGIGVDNVDVTAATELGIAVGYVPAASVEEVSDHALALALSLSRSIPGVEAAVRRGEVAAAMALPGSSRRFADLTLGIVGFGRIGRALARKAESVFGRIVAFDPMVDPSAAGRGAVDLVPLDELWRLADVVSLHAPGSATGEPLVDAVALASMRPGVVLVNTARGQLVDEAALIDAVRSGHVRGAGLDVTAHEPLPVDDPLLHCPGIVVTGHTASKGAESGPALRRGVIDAVRAVVEGGLPQHLADPAVADSPHLRITLVARPTEGPQ